MITNSKGMTEERIAEELKIKNTGPKEHENPYTFRA